LRGRSLAYIMVYMTTVTVSAAEARASLKELLDAVELTHQRYRITRNGRPGAVLIAAEDLDALEETLDILSDPEEVAAIAEGTAELDRGEGIPLERVRAEMGL
jgi:antitoxin YefM